MLYTETGHKLCQVLVGSFCQPRYIYGSICRKARITFSPKLLPLCKTKQTPYKYMSTLRISAR